MKIRGIYWRSLLLLLAPGLLLSLSLASIALLLRTTSGLTALSPLMLAIVLGILVRNLSQVPALYQPGITFALKRLLRVAIALLGLQLSLVQLQQVGLVGFMVMTVVLWLSFAFTCWLGHTLQMRRNLVCLIAAGTAICGASAIVATSTVLDSSDEDTAYAVATVTLFGTLSMLLYPLVQSFLQLSAPAFGVWCGASIHEVAQVIAAAFQVNAISGDLASITKLSRVLWLAPLAIGLGLFTRPGRSDRPGLRSYPTLPWFIIIFVGLILLNSTGIIPELLKTGLGQMNQYLLTVAMAAMGLETRLQNIWKLGLKPIYLGGAAWLFITLLSLGLVNLVY
ncbi:hypothetical protein BST81_16955 [Leptolyngbya sp. 'hensonii']|nr:hypothetical protein BST81_16955 [Leptolyngbya sp. 'hensonii']